MEPASALALIVGGDDDASLDLGSSVTDGDIAGARDEPDDDEEEEEEDDDEDDEDDDEDGEEEDDEEGEGGDGAGAAEAEDDEASRRRAKRSEKEEQHAAKRARARALRRAAAGRAEPPLRVLLRGCRLASHEARLAEFGFRSPEDLVEADLCAKLQAATGAHKPNGYEFEKDVFTESDYYGLGIGKDCKST